MPRSTQGLEAAGEWRALQSMLPELKGKRVLDLGCGFGWHCVYAAEQGALSVVGVDISEKMLANAKEQTKYSQVRYVRVPIEDFDYPESSFDAVISSLALHYVKSFDDICDKVSKCLAPSGDFVFSVEHPIFTAQGRQDWIYGEAGNILHWPVDRYFDEGERTARFLDEDIIKYHRTLTTYIECLLRHGFSIIGVCEPEPPEEMLMLPGMNDELRRPMMLIISAKKKWSPVEFRMAKDSDSQALKDIAKRVINTNYSSFLGKNTTSSFVESGASDKEIDDGLENCTLMLRDGRIIGFAVTYDDLLHLMMIDVPFQRSGHGTVLLAHMEEKLFGKYKRIRLQTFRDNASAVGLYLKNGWTTSQADVTEPNAAMLQFTKTVSIQTDKIYSGVKK